MDIARIQKLAGIIVEGADVTKKIAAGTVKTADKAEAISNQIVQGKGGDIQVSDEAKPEDKPTVPKDVKAKKALSLKEGFNDVQSFQRRVPPPLTSSVFRQQPQAPGAAPQGQVPGGAPQGQAPAQSPMANAYAAYKQWKDQCLEKDPKCTFTGTKEGTEAVNWSSSRPRAVGKFIKAEQKGIVYGVNDQR